MKLKFEELLSSIQLWRVASHSACLRHGAQRRSVQSIITAKDTSTLPTGNPDVRSTGMRVRFRATAAHFAMLRGCFLGGPPATVFRYDSCYGRVLIQCMSKTVSTTLKVRNPRSDRPTRNVPHTACSIAACNTHNVPRTLLALDVNLRREIDRRRRTFSNKHLQAFCAWDPMIHTYAWLPALPLTAHSRNDCRT